MLSKVQQGDTFPPKPLKLLRQMFGAWFSVSQNFESTAKQFLRRLSNDQHFIIIFFLNRHQDDEDLNEKDADDMRTIELSFRDMTENSAQDEMPSPINYNYELLYLLLSNYESEVKLTSETATCLWSILLDPPCLWASRGNTEQGKVKLFIIYPNDLSSNPAI